MERDLEDPASVSETAGEATDPATKPVAVEEISGSARPDDTTTQIVHATRSWIQYGMVGFAVFCIIIGAVEGLFGR